MKCVISIYLVVAIVCAPCVQAREARAGKTNIQLKREIYNELDAKSPEEALKTLEQERKKAELFRNEIEKLKADLSQAKAKANTRDARSYQLANGLMWTAVAVGGGSLLLTVGASLLNSHYYAPHPATGFGIVTFFASLPVIAGSLIYKNFFVDHDTIQLNHEQVVELEETLDLALIDLEQALETITIMEAYFKIKKETEEVLKNANN